MTETPSKTELEARRAGEGKIFTLKIFPNKNHLSIRTDERYCCYPSCVPGVSQPHLRELRSGQTQTHTVLIRETETAHISVTEGSLGG